MKAITLHQPFASLIALGAACPYEPTDPAGAGHPVQGGPRKRYETRSWPTDYTGRLAIHAAKTTEALHLFRDVPEIGASLYNGLGIETADRLPLGKVVCTCTVADCTRIAESRVVGHYERAFGDYAPGRYAWQLIDVLACKEPVPARGYQKFWKPDKELRIRIRKATGERFRNAAPPAPLFNHPPTP